MIKDLETGKTYRITENGERIEVAEGEVLPIEDFMKHLGYDAKLSVIHFLLNLINYSQNSREVMDDMSSSSDSPTHTRTKCHN